MNRSRLSCKHFGGNDESRCSRDQQRRPTCAASHEEYVAQAMCLVGLHTSFEAIANGERITLNTPATGDIEHPTTKPRHPRSSREYEPNHQGLTPTSSFAKHGLHNSSASPSIRAIKCRDTKHLGIFLGFEPRRFHLLPQSQINSRSNAPSSFTPCWYEWITRRARSSRSVSVVICRTELMWSNTLWQRATSSSLNTVCASAIWDRIMIALTSFGTIMGWNISF